MPSGTKSAGFLGHKTQDGLQGSQSKRQGRADRQGDMYNMKWPPFDNNDVEKRINGVLGPLSLFAPFSHEDIIYPEDLEPKAPEEKPDLGLERPVTPIDEEIKTQPLSFEKLAKYIRRRISPRSDVPHLSTDDQQMLAGILIGEVTDVWPEIRRQIDDPFLVGQTTQKETSV